MGLLDALRGRRRPAPHSWSDALGAMARASTRLQAQLQTYPTGRAGLIVRPEEQGSTDQGMRGLEDALRDDEPLRAVRHRVEADDHGHFWVMVRGDTLEELAEGLRLASGALVARGNEQRLLAAVFPFTWKEKRPYWIYTPRVGRFTPFVPTGRDQLRDHPMEVRMEASMRGHIPTERDPSHWYPLWEAPI